MARPFKYPEVTALSIGEYVVVQTTESFGSFKKRCDLHAARGTGKAFAYIQIGPDQIQVARHPVEAADTTQHQA